MKIKMPTINKGKKVNNYVKHDKAKDIYNYVYNTAKWRKLRQAYLMQHPLCEMCKKDGKVKEATEVHHITPISKAESELQMKELGYNPNNLMALCEECHHKLHNEMKN